MRNPVRRGRNIGKTQGGRVMNGKPQEKLSRCFSRDLWARLSEEENPGFLQVLIDNPSRNYIHPVTEAEVRKTLGRMPRKLTRRLKAVVMPRMRLQDKQRGVEAWRRYSCIILNPFPRDLRLYWSASPPDRFARSHYEPWRAKWQEDANGWYQVWDLESLKRYYLYHLLLHELGHINDLRFTSSLQRESFAEDFALTWARKLNVLEKPRPPRESQ